MMSVVITIIMAALACIIYFTTDEESLDDPVKDKEFEKEFIHLVCQIDKGNINWTLRTLKMLKSGYKHYSDNDKAMSIMRLLRKHQNMKVINYIKSMEE